MNNSDTNQDIIVELISITPDILWVLLGLIIFIFAYRILKSDILPNMRSISAYGVEIHLLSSTIDLIIKVAEKNEKWKVEVSDRDKDILIKRVQRNYEIFKDIDILWFDDRADTLSNEIKMFEQIGINVKVIPTLKEALDELSSKKYALMVSDIARDNGEKNGLDTLKDIRESGYKTPTIFYIGEINESLGIPAYAFNITNRPDMLLHLVIDILERERE